MTLALENAQKQNKCDLQFKKIWSVSTRLSKHLIAIRNLNKLETASISICKQNKSNMKNNLEFSSKRIINPMHIISSDDHI